MTRRIGASSLRQPRDLGVVILKPLKDLSLNNMRSSIFLAITSLIAIDQAVKAIFLFLKKETLINDSGIFSLPIRPEITTVSTFVILLSLFIFLVGKEISIFGIYTSKQVNKEQKLAIYWPVILIFCGGISNSIDRVIHSGVLDILFFKTAAWNIADVYIGIGAGIILIKSFFLIKKKSQPSATM